MLITYDRISEFMNVNTIKRIITILMIILIIVFFILSIFLILNVNGNYNNSKSDTIIVLGSGIMINNKLNPCMYKRVEHAVNLYKKGYSDTIIFSGGNDEDTQINEAEAMNKIARELGFDGKSILEKNASSTYENLLFSKEILDNNNLNNAVIVTEKFHVGRTLLTSESVNIDAMVSPADSYCWEKFRYFSKFFVREVIVTYYYFLTNKINLVKVVF